MQEIKPIENLIDINLETNSASTRVLFLGRHLHKIKREFTLMKGRSNTNAGRPYKEATTPLAERDAEAIRKSINRSRKKLKQQFLCNFYDGYTFITLTFADTDAFDVTNIEACLEQFKLFKKRLTMHIKRHALQEPLKWIGAIEFQDDTRNGAIHFHLVSNLTSIDNKELHRIWGLGSTDMKFIQSSAHSDPKMAWYLSDGIEDSRLNICRTVTNKICSYCYNFC